MKFKNFCVTRILLLAFVLAVGLLALSCRDFFMTSWFSWAARNPDGLVPPVTTENVADIIQTFEDDPDASLEVLKKIKDAAGGLSGEEKNKLLGASLEAAVNAVGLGQTVLNAAGNLANIESTDIKATLKDALNSLSNLEETNTLLLDMLPAPDDAAFTAFTDAAGADDLAMTAVVLLMGEAATLSDNAIDDLLADPSSYNTNASTPAVAQAIAIANALDARKDELTGPMKDILDQLKLNDQNP